MNLVPYSLAALCACSDAPEPPSRYTLRGSWGAPAELLFRVDAERAPLDAAALRRAVEEAGAPWSALAPLRLRAAGEHEEPDFTVSFERGDHGPCQPFGADTSVAHTGPVSRGTFVHLDAERDWAAGSPGLRDVLLHELGHVLGLGHSPDPGALMHPDPSVAAITASDRDGVWTLYGGGGAPGSRDVVVERVLAAGSEHLAVVRGIGAADTTDFELFDTDGDGDDELVAWRTDEAGVGELVVFHFAPGPRVAHTVGPRAGMVGAGAAVDFIHTPEGDRLLVVEYPSGNRFARAFDQRGRLEPWDAERAPRRDGTRGRRFEGDLDGDGRAERVRRP